jgi:hypothetical protein
MAQVPFPTVANMVEVTWDIDVPMQRNRSGWTGTSKGVGLPGSTSWFATVRPHDVFDPADKRALRAFVAQMRGQGNWTAVPAPVPQQTSAANPVTRSTGLSGGFTLPLQGLPLSTTVLLAGDFMTVPLPSGHYRMGILMQDLASNGSGQGTAVLDREIREVPAAGVTVEIRNPFAAMRFANARNGWSDAYAAASFAFELEENL